MKGEVPIELSWKLLLDMDWRNNKIEGGWRIKSISGTGVNKLKKLNDGKIVVDEVWRKDGQIGSNNSNQIMNLPPRMMRKMLENHDKSGPNESNNEESGHSTSSSTNSYTEFSKLNANEIFSLRKPKTLFEVTQLLIFKFLNPLISY